MRRHGRAVVQAVRADDRLLGAGLALRLVLARPDALGLLARPARPDAHALVHQPLARLLQPLVRPPGRALQGRHRLGARPSLLDGRASAIASFVGALALPAMGLGRRRASCPTRTTRSSPIDLETPPGSNLDYTKAQGAGSWRAWPAAARRCAYTYTTIGGATRLGRRHGIVYVKLMPKTERPRSQAIVEADLRAASSCRSAASPPSISSGGTEGAEADPAPAPAARTRRARRGWRSRSSPKCARCRAPSTSASRPRARSRSSRCSSTAASPARSASPSARWRRRCAPPSPASTPATGSIPRARRATSPSASRRRRARVGGATSQSLPLLVPRPGVARSDADPARAGGADHAAAIGPARIDHLDRDRVITVEANTEGRSLTEVVSDITARIDKNVKLPAGLRAQPGRRGARTRPRSSRRSARARASRCMLMYFVLVVQFGSFLEPLAIMLSLPLSLIGVMLALC